MVSPFSPIPAQQQQGSKGFLLSATSHLPTHCPLLALHPSSPLAHISAWQPISDCSAARNLCGTEDSFNCYVWICEIVRLLVTPTQTQSPACLPGVWCPACASPSPHLHPWHPQIMHHGCHAPNVGLPACTLSHSFPTPIPPVTHPWRKWGSVSPPARCGSHPHWCAARGVLAL